MPTADERWASASIEGKLEMLRHDLKLIQDAHNGLAQDYRELLRRQQVFAGALQQALLQSPQPTVAAEPTNQQETHQADSNGDPTSA